jgi:hypothetical protein
MTTPRQSTLLDLVQAVSVYATSDAETLATVAYMINSGQVRLCGSFAGRGSTWPRQLTLSLDHFSSIRRTLSLITATMLVASVWRSVFPLQPWLLNFWLPVF